MSRFRMYLTRDEDSGVMLSLNKPHKSSKCWTSPGECFGFDDFDYDYKHEWGVDPQWSDEIPTMVEFEVNRVSDGKKKTITYKSFWTLDDMRKWVDENNIFDIISIETLAVGYNIWYRK